MILLSNNFSSQNSFFFFFNVMELHIFKNFYFTKFFFNDRNLNLPCSDLINSLSSFRPQWHIFSEGHRWCFCLTAVFET